MKRFIAIHFLIPLTVRNYRRRASGIIPDQWYWADKLIIKWGFVDELSQHLPWLSFHWE